MSEDSEPLALASADLEFAVKAFRRGDYDLCEVRLERVLHIIRQNHRRMRAFREETKRIAALNKVRL